jgi:hypothetical protein
VSVALGDDLRGTGHFAANPTDRGDQLGDGVLSGHRVIEHRRVHSAPGPPFSTPVWAITAHYRTSSRTQGLFSALLGGVLEGA